MRGDAFPAEPGSRRRKAEGLVARVRRWKSGRHRTTGSRQSVARCVSAAHRAGAISGSITETAFCHRSARLPSMSMPMRAVESRPYRGGRSIVLRAPARTLDALLHRDVGALQLLRHARLPHPVHGRARSRSAGMGLDTAAAAAIYGTYTSMVYLLSLPGGWIADRLIGQRRAVLYGGDTDCGRTFLAGGADRSRCSISA